jgi:DNA polymerase III delta prime subunit
VDQQDRLNPRDRPLAAGPHLKRGLLLHGPPGTGKTHTVRFLIRSLVGTTVLQLTGNAMHLIAEAPSRGSHRACEG